MSTIPIICRTCGTAGKVAKVTTNLSCPTCKTGANLDLHHEIIDAQAARDEAKQVTASGTEWYVARSAPETKRGFVDVAGPFASEAEAEAAKPRDGGSYVTWSKRSEQDQVAYERFMTGKRRQAAYDDPSGPMPWLPKGTPDQDRDMALVDPNRPVKVPVPQGSAPYTVRALSSKRAKAEWFVWNGETPVSGPYASEEEAEKAKTSQSQSVDQKDEVDGYGNVQAKRQRIAARVQADNPHLDARSVLAVADKVLSRYASVVKQAASDVSIINVPSGQIAVDEDGSRAGMWTTRGGQNSGYAWGKSYRSHEEWEAALEAGPAEGYKAIPEFKVDGYGPVRDGQGRLVRLDGTTYPWTQG